MGRSVLNLTFHGVGDPGRDVEPLERAVWLSERELETALDCVAAVDGIALSFDDGNLSDAEIALPALVRRGLVATFFVCAGRIGAPGFVGPEEIERLLAAGMTIGSHGMHHRAWRGLDRIELSDELAAARSELESIAGTRVRDAACPFGSYDRRVLAALADAGYERVYTSDGGLADADAWLQPRNTLGRGSDVAAEIAGNRRRRSPAATLVREAKLAIKARR